MSNLFFVKACNPDNNYGLNYNGVSYDPPPGAQGNSSYGPDNFFTSTPAECCAACFTTLGCGEFIFNNNDCTLFVWDGITVTNPYNPVCPWGLGSFGGGTGFSIAPGPCAIV
jgi:PAN domain